LYAFLVFEKRVKMPKQGQFAKSVRQKKLNDFKVKRHEQGAVIDETQLTDFLTVRLKRNCQAFSASRHNDCCKRLHRVCGIRMVGWLI
jgi:hypothetical protein